MLLTETSGGLTADANDHLPSNLLGFLDGLGDDDARPFEEPSLDSSAWAVGEGWRPRDEPTPPPVDRLPATDDADGLGARLADESPGRRRNRPGAVSSLETREAAPSATRGASFCEPRRARGSSLDGGRGAAGRRAAAKRGASRFREVPVECGASRRRRGSGSSSPAQADVRRARVVLGDGRRIHARRRARVPRGAVPKPSSRAFLRRGGGRDPRLEDSVIAQVRRPGVLLGDGGRVPPVARLRVRRLRRFRFRRVPAGGRAPVVVDGVPVVGLGRVPPGRGRVPPVARRAAK